MNLFFVSLGCDKNLVDSEKMIALLASQNISVTSTPEDAEIIIVNTCGFIHDAKEESIETILEMAEYKKTGKCVSLIMTGCLAQRYADDIQKEIPEVDAVVGTTAYDRIFEVVKDTLQGKKECALNDLDYLPKNLTNRVHTSSGYSSYLKIAEELKYVAGRASNIVFVSDYIYSDAVIYDELSEDYRRGLGYIDRALAGICDRVTEVAYGQLFDYKR